MRVRVRLAAASAAALMCGAFAAAPIAVHAAPNLQLVSSSQWGPDSLGDMHIVGEVRNGPTGYSEFNKVNFNFYSSTGQLLGTDFTYTSVATLAPGELSPFEDIFTPPAGYDHYTIPSIDSSATNAPPNHNFSTQITNQYVDSIGDLHIVGTVTNHNSTDDTYVKIVFTFYDCSARTVDADFTYVNGSPPTVAAGQNTSFELIRSSSPPGFTSYAAMAQSSDAASPYANPGRTVVATPPQAPTSVSALAGDGVATVSWATPPCSSGAAALTYTVTSSPGGLTASTSANQVNVTGLTNGTSYTFTVTATNSAGTSPPSAPSNAVTPNAITGASFYFAEGFTGPGFQEDLSLFMPNQSGTAQIDYYTESGHAPSVLVQLAAGQVKVENVNQDVGVYQQVSVRVQLPGTGVAERAIHFRFAAWYGSTDKVGVSAPAREWDFAEGSTLSFFSEYVTLQNPNAGPAAVQLHYFTDAGQHPTKTLSLAAGSRTTVEVFNGDASSDLGTCVPNGAGASCGVGAGVGGVSVQVVSDQPIVAERPFYVNGFSFGSGSIRDGHDAFGANAAGMVWNFAEGTTVPGFNEYLTLQNPNSTPTTVDLRYFLDTGEHPIKSLVLNPTSRTTIEVSKGQPIYDSNCIAGPGGNCGVGPGITGVSVQVTSRSLPIVAERPLYIVRNFGSGVVAGAHVAVGSTGLAQSFSFANASTAPGESDFLTIQNPNATDANVTATYYLASGPTPRTIRVAGHSRHTVQLLDPVEGPGPGNGRVGIALSSDQPVLIEKPTYSTDSSTYGATDTVGYSASWVQTPTPPPPPQNVRNNPWGYNFDNAGSYITSPPSNFCDYFPCIPSFWNQVNGYVEECGDDTYSHSGGQSGSCSFHGGNKQALYLPY